MTAREAGLSTKSLISVIDDDESVGEAIKSLLESLGYTVDVFASAMDFLVCPTVRDTSCLITDVQMPRMTGVELHARLLESGYAIPTILITAYPDDGIRAHVLAAGVICYLSKPLDEDALLQCVRLALERTKDHS
jgi:FixJ family two-component response regulator